jgi:hypothetical protein
MCLDREQYRAVKPGGQVGGRDRARMRGVLLDRTLDPQPGGIHGPDDGRVGVADQHIMAIASECGRDRAADGAAAEHYIPHGAHVTTRLRPPQRAHAAIYNRARRPSHLVRQRFALRHSGVPTLAGLRATELRTRCPVTHVLRDAAASAVA